MKTKTITNVGVVGAGTMGSALAQKFAQVGFSVILADKTFEQVEKGVRNITAVLQEGVARNVFSREKMDKVLANIRSTEKLEDLRSCDIVIEAIYENFEAKVDLFIKLSKILSKNCILATNTSSYAVSELACSVEFPERFIGLHFFYHAAKNRLVEIIPGENTSAETYEVARRFALIAGKDPITCGDVYGFVVNRFFVPWLNEAARIYEEGIAPIPVIDRICRSVFGIGMGPFELMNATGVPVAYHAEKTLEVFGNLYHVAEGLKNQALDGKNWEIGSEDGMIVSPETETLVRERLLGVVLFVSTQILDESICTATDLNRGARIGLKWKRGPVELMQKLGVTEVKRLIQAIASRYSMPMPISLGEVFWNMKTVRCTRKGRLATIIMDQPESMNALSGETIRQLWDCFSTAESDPEIDTIFITGSGKAFVAGADIRFFLDNMRNDRICDIETFTEIGQRIFERIDRSRKQVVAALNGLTLGGGLELALCADVLIATPNAMLAFPETGIGIYPGLGGTQRTRQRIGTSLAKYLVLTGKMITAEEAQEIGLVRKVVSLPEMLEILAGEKAVPRAGRGNPKRKWKQVESFFKKNTLDEILSRRYNAHNLPQPEAEKISDALQTRAPIALRIADTLISNAKGPRSELEHLRTIFSTKDALAGLSSIGKKVEFTGQ